MTAYVLVIKDMITKCVKVTVSSDPEVALRCTMYGAGHTCEITHVIPCATRRVAVFKRRVLAHYLSEYVMYSVVECNNGNRIAYRSGWYRPDVWIRIAINSEVLDMAIDSFAKFYGRNTSCCLDDFLPPCV